jgi:hypothetical protein
METVASTPCGGCGASVPVFAARSSTCAYCGTHTDAGEQLASAREMVEHAEAIEAAGRQALQFATYRSSVGGASTGVWMAAFIFLPPLVLVFVKGWLYAVGWFFVAAGLLAVFNDIRATKKADATTRQVQAQTALVEALRTGAIPSNCPSCGALVSIPALNCAFPCAHCGTSMLASEGLLIARVEDASERQAALMAQARRVLGAYHEKFAQDADAQHDTVMFGMIGVLLVIFVGGWMYVVNG